MYILTRYVVWEVMKFFVAALVALTLFVTLGMGVQKALQTGWPPGVMLRIMPFLMPTTLGIAIPVALLFAVSSVFGRMTGSNEIVALKSLGISPMAAVWPALVFSAFLSLGTVCMYELAAWCQSKLIQIGSESIQEIAYSMLQKNRSFGGDNYPFSATVRRVDGRTLIEPRITIKGPPEITLTAAEATLSTDLPNRLLWITFIESDVEIEGMGMVKVPRTEGNGEVRVERYSVPIPVLPPPRYHRDYVAMRNVPQLIGELQSSLRALESIRDANKKLGVPDSPANLEKMRIFREDIPRLATEPYRRWANGFSCLCFALIGAPVAMLRRNADMLTNFFFCFLPILVIYYPLLMFGEDLSTSGRAPPISFWMANMALLLPALLLLRRIIRH